MRFGLRIMRDGFNMFVLGQPGSGRHRLAERLIEQIREERADEALLDICYVNDFDANIAPRLLHLPAGKGRELRDDMEAFVDDLGPAIAAAFESEDYRLRVRTLEAAFKERQQGALRSLGDASLAHGIALVENDEGFSFMPVKEDNREVMTHEELEALPESKRRELRKSIGEFEEPLLELLGKLPRWRRDLKEALKEIGTQAIRGAANLLLGPLRLKYAALGAVQAFLDAVENDVVETGETMREPQKPDTDTEMTLFSGTIPVQRYLVNLLVDQADRDRPPFVIEHHPTFQNLVGRIEHIAHMGTLMSNFMLIRAGALHRANGGYLLLDAIKLLSLPNAWEGLKLALTTREIRIESLGEMFGLASTLQLQPEPVPLALKVILVGEPEVYYLLDELDPEFARLFKVAADFEDEIPRTPAASRQYAQLIATATRCDGLRPFSRAAVARVIEHAARLADDAERLTTLSQPIVDLLHEADYIAGDETAVSDRHVEQALAASMHRQNRIQTWHYDAIRRGTLVIATRDTLVGQVNGLAAVGLGSFVFGHPVRLSAAVRIGDGEMIDIQREIDLGGPLHSKGVLILAGFFSARFGRGIPLAFNASITFEQTYGEVEGDSASLAELCALLSAIGALPIQQRWGVTGAVNQYGEVQAIGAVNEKIEGFFDVCAAQGLSGEQGVIIPAANVKELMLKREVRDAVAARRFHVVSVTHVDDAIELLTGLPIGIANEENIIPEGSVNYLVATRLVEMQALKHAAGEDERKRKRNRRS